MPFLVSTVLIQETQEQKRLLKTAWADQNLHTLTTLNIKDQNIILRKLYFIQYYVTKKLVLKGSVG